MTADVPGSDADDRASHLRATHQQLKWLEAEAARLGMTGPLIDSVIDSLRQRIRTLEAEDGAARIERSKVRARWSRRDARSRRRR